MSAELFTKSSRDGKNILQLKPAFLTNPGATALGRVTYEIVDGNLLQTRTGVILKSTCSRNIEDIVGIDVKRNVGSTVLGFGAADLTFRDASGSGNLVWENVQRAEEVADYIRTLKKDLSVWPFSDSTSSEKAGARILEIARKTNRTDFGSLLFPSGPVSEVQATLIRWVHRYGEPMREIERDVVWTNNGDGTATDPDHRLMWIRAPWGMIWDGKAFTGNPIRVSWREATRMFGKGTYVEGNEDGICYLSPDERAATGVEFGYERGSCIVDFAGFMDWRLPTVADWETARIWEKAKVSPSDAIFVANSFSWTASGRSQSSFLWTDSHCAWKKSVGTLSDDTAELEYEVRFVRDIRR